VCRGNTLKQIQMDSGCKMAIRGKGTVKSKDGQTEQQVHNPEPCTLNPEASTPSYAPSIMLAGMRPTLLELEYRCGRVQVRKALERRT